MQFVRKTAEDSENKFKDLRSKFGENIKTRWKEEQSLDTKNQFLK